MTGKEFELLIEAEKLQRKAEPILLDFLKKHREERLIFENTRTVQDWLEDVYPEITDESEQDEELISAFVAGMMFIMINATSNTGVRWIHVLPPMENDSE